MFKTKDVEIRGEKYSLKELSAGERQQLLSKVGEVDNTEINALMVSLCCDKFASLDEVLSLPSVVFDELVAAGNDLSEPDEKKS